MRPARRPRAAAGTNPAWKNNGLLSGGWHDLPGSNRETPDANSDLLVSSRPAGRRGAAQQRRQKLQQWRRPQLLLAQLEFRQQSQVQLRQQSQLKFRRQSQFQFGEQPRFGWKFHAQFKLRQRQREPDPHCEWRRQRGKQSRDQREQGVRFQQQQRQELQFQQWEEL
jgi:hypothetical protein